MNSGFSPETVTYHITPHANGCDGPVSDFIVTVVSSPDVFFNPPAQTRCSGVTSAIQILSSVPGTTFTWTASASSPSLTGFLGGQGNLIAQNVFNSGNTIETVTYNVTPVAWGCPPGNAQNVLLSVNPKPMVINTITLSSICNNTSTNIIPLSSVPGQPSPGLLTLHPRWFQGSLTEVGSSYSRHWSIPALILTPSFIR